jgi:hypothetical protein
MLPLEPFRPDGPGDMRGWRSGDVELMWRQLWRKWTIDRPAAFGDLLWEVFVVQLAAFLDRLTWRRIVAVLPLVLLILAYAHEIPVPPELALVGDFLAYIDVISVLFLFSVLSRVTTIYYLLKQATSQALKLVSQVQLMMHRLGARHRREGGARSRMRLGNRGRKSDEDRAVMPGLAWA